MEVIELTAAIEQWYTSTDESWRNPKSGRCLIRYQYRKDLGQAGFWYRYSDDRVFDADGKECPSDPAIYGEPEPWEEWHWDSAKMRKKRFDDFIAGQERLYAALREDDEGRRTVVHLYRKDLNRRGAWYRFSNGCVLDRFGNDTPTDPAIYDDPVSYEIHDDVIAAHVEAAIQRINKAFEEDREGELTKVHHRRLDTDEEGRWYRFSSGLVLDQFGEPAPVDLDLYDQPVPFLKRYIRIAAVNDGAE